MITGIILICQLGKGIQPESCMFLTHDAFFETTQECVDDITTVVKAGEVEKNYPGFRAVDAKCIDWDEMKA